MPLGIAAAIFLSRARPQNVTYRWIIAHRSYFRNHGITGHVARKSGKKPDYMLAVRYDNGDDQRIGQILGELQQKTKGEMDAQEVGQIRALNWYQQANRPCVAGSSVMLERHNGAGTLGAFVHRDDDGAVYLLSNSHVIADSGNAQLGDAVIQPGGLDGGTRSDRIATLSEHAPIDFTSGVANKRRFLGLRHRRNGRLRQRAPRQVCEPTGIQDCDSWPDILECWRQWLYHPGRGSVRRRAAIRGQPNRRTRADWCHIREPATHGSRQAAYPFGCLAIARNSGYV